MKESINKRINLTDDEKSMLSGIISMYEENGDDSYAMDKNTVAFKNLVKACEYSNKPELNKKMVQKCLKKLGS